MNLMKNVNVPKVIKTERLELRLLDMTMVEDLSDSIHASLEEFKPWFVWVHPKAPSLKDTKEFTELNMKAQEAKEEFHYCIYTKDTNTFVGRVSLDKAQPKVPSYNIGYWLDSRHSGNGYMYEAVTALIKMGWNDLPTRRLEIYHDTQNTASEKIIKKLVSDFGFRFEAEIINALRHPDGSLRSDMRYALTRSD